MLYKNIQLNLYSFISQFFKYLLPIGLKFSSYSKAVITQKKCECPTTAIFFPGFYF